MRSYDGQHCYYCGERVLILEVHCRRCGRYLEPRETRFIAYVLGVAAIVLTVIFGDADFDLAKIANYLSDG